ncbi:MAG: hypothetical protein ACXWUG_24695 [Polyangiales bacterium]
MTVDEAHFQFCTSCGTRSPEIETNYTLISAKFGWRLLRTKGAGGEYLLHWYCPKCWSKRKGDGGPPSSTR